MMKSIFYRDFKEEKENLKRMNLSEDEFKRIKEEIELYEKFFLYLSLLEDYKEENEEEKEYELLKEIIFIREEFNIFFESDFENQKEEEDISFESYKEILFDMILYDEISFRDIF